MWSTLEKFLSLFRQSQISCYLSVWPASQCFCNAVTFKISGEKARFQLLPFSFQCTNVQAKTIHLCRQYRKQSSRKIQITTTEYNQIFINYIYKNWVRKQLIETLIKFNILLNKYVKIYIKHKRGFVGTKIFHRHYSFVVGKCSITLKNHMLGKIE